MKKKFSWKNRRHETIKHELLGNKANISQLIRGKGGIIKISGG